MPLPSCPTPASRERLLHLLAEAAEFEHNLLCCYLYAAFSLKARDASDLLEHEQAAVDRWYGSIMAVAIEEMAHLALVANLSVAIGARPHLDRPNLPVAPGYHPASVVVALAPFDAATLDHFIFLERPAEVALEDAAAFQPEEVPTRAPTALGLTPSSFDYDNIAQFYEALRCGFETVAAAIGSERLFIGTAHGQIGPELLALPGMRRIATLDDARSAIDTIVVQGEGSSTASETSHFERFIAIRREHDALREARPGFQPAWPCARDPVMRRPVGAADHVHIDAQPAAGVLDVANAIYNQMLRLLAQAWGRAAPDAHAQRLLLDAATASMGCVARLGRHLASLPASASRPGVHAGMSFTMLRATDPLLEGDAEWELLASRFDELAQGLGTACAHAPRLAGEADGFAALAQRFRARSTLRPVVVAR